MEYMRLVRRDQNRVYSGSEVPGDVEKLAGENLRKVSKRGSLFEERGRGSGCNSRTRTTSGRLEIFEWRFV